MERFEPCYRLPDSRPTTWLAPQLLPSIPEALNIWASIDDLVLSYRYGFLPKELISRLIVRMHRYVKHPELAWTNGAFFEREDTQLLVQTIPRGDEVVLRQDLVSKCCRLYRVSRLDFWPKLLVACYAQ